MEILKYPHPTLRHKSKPLLKIDSELKRFVEEMFELMYATDGIGLAANQVDLPYQLFVMNTSGDVKKPETEYVLINPVILKRKNRSEDSEGCLSFPEITASVIRAAEIELEAITLRGEVKKYSLRGLMARAVQHEMDHLNGVCFIDRLSPSALLSIQEDLTALETTFETNRRLGFLPTDEEIMVRLESLESERT